MGYMRHHAILLSGGDWGKISITQIHQKACEILSADGITLVSELTPKMVNDCQFFVIYPDGSKEGWEASDLWDARRKIFLEWLKRQRYRDGSGPCEWVFLQFGDDEGDNKILDDSDQDRRSKKTHMERK